MTLHELRQHRLAGRKPDFQVFLTLMPELRPHIPGQVITVASNDDLAALTELSVWVCCHSSQGDAALDLIERVVAVSPRDLIFWIVDLGVMQNVIECGERTNTRAVPNEALRQTMEALTCSS